MVFIHNSVYMCVMIFADSSERNTLMSVLNSVENYSLLSFFKCWQKVINSTLSLTIVRDSKIKQVFCFRICVACC